VLSSAGIGLEGDLASRIVLFHVRSLIVFRLFWGSRPEGDPVLLQGVYSVKLLVYLVLRSVYMVSRARCTAFAHELKTHASGQTLRALLSPHFFPPMRR
jgi:hypothetical protein